MIDIFDLYMKVIDKVGLFYTIKCMIVGLGIILIYARVFKNFSDARDQKNNKKKEVKSIVETFSMSSFFIIVWLVVKMIIVSY